MDFEKFSLVMYRVWEGNLLVKTECPQLLEWEKCPSDHMQFIRPVLQLCSAEDHAFVLEKLLENNEPMAVAVRLFCRRLVMI
jgi:hypothetical protein